MKQFSSLALSGFLIVVLLFCIGFFLTLSITSCSLSFVQTDNHKTPSEVNQDDKTIRGED